VDNLILSLTLNLYKLRGETRFREWVKLEEQKEKIAKAVRDGSDEFPTHLLSFLSTALHVNSRYFEDAEWNKIIEAFYRVLLKSPVVDLPITKSTNDTESKEDWDYDGRTWHVYAHLLADHYGWTLEYISRLQVVEALAKIQEILTEEQLDREFQHSLSEIAYPYDANTKKSKFTPLTRPSWMRPKIKAIRRYKIPKRVMPIGDVDYAALPPELQPKET
jgi:hypothetical protein